MSNFRTINRIQNTLISVVDEPHSFLRRFLYSSVLRRTRLGPGARRASSTAIHRPLNKDKHEIRLLRVYPGQRNDDVLCDLQVASLDFRPRYNTLSYHWGPPNPKEVISVDNVPVPVTVNLFQALKAVRRRRQIVTIWADAICINQEDKNEQGSQVALMGRIYKQSKQTWISLGSPEHDWAQGPWAPRHKIEERMARIQRLVRGTWRLFWHHLILRRSRKSRLGVNHVSDTLRVFLSLWSRSDLDAQQKKDLDTARSMLTWLISNEYWVRVWIMQEVALSNDDPICIFGIYQIPLLSLDGIMNDWRVALYPSSKADEDIDGKTAWSLDMSKKLKRTTTICMLRDQYTVLSRVFGFGYHLDLLQCLELGSRGRATIPIDHIYGLHSVLSPADQKQLPPDCTLSPGELYPTATKMLIQKLKSASILCAAVGTGKRNQHKLPSWSLDFSQPLKTPVSRGGIEVSNFGYEDCSSTSEHLRINGRKKDIAIAVQYWYWSRIESTLVLDCHDDFTEQVSGIICRFLGTDIQPSHPIDNENFFHVLLANVYQEAEHRALGTELHPFSDRTVEESHLNLDLLKTLRKWGRGLCLIYQAYARLSSKSQTGDMQVSTEERQEFMKLFILLLKNQALFPDLFSGHLFQTSQGSIGKASGEVEVDDEIWELPGSATKFVLRPSKDGGFLNMNAQSTRVYTLVGPCIYGELGQTDDAPLNDTAEHIEIV